MNRCLREDIAAKTKGIGVYLGGEAQDTKGTKL